MMIQSQVMKMVAIEVEKMLACFGKKCYNTKRVDHSERRSFYFSMKTWKQKELHANTTTNLIRYVSS